MPCFPFRFPGPVSALVPGLAVMPCFPFRFPGLPAEARRAEEGPVSELIFSPPPAKILHYNEPLGKTGRASAELQPGFSTRLYTLFPWLIVSYQNGICRPTTSRKG